MKRNKMLSGMLVFNLVIPLSSAATPIEKAMKNTTDSYKISNAALLQQMQEAAVMRTILQNVNTLPKTTQGLQALRLLQHLAYLDTQAIPFEWIITWDLSSKNDDYSHHELRAALCLLERHSFLQWDRNGRAIHIQNLVQRAVRLAHPLQSLSPLVNTLAAYAENDKHKTQPHVRYTQVYSHAKKLHEYLNQLASEHKDIDYSAEIATVDSSLAKATQTLDLEK